MHGLMFLVLLVAPTELDRDYDKALGGLQVAMADLNYKAPDDADEGGGTRKPDPNCRICRGSGKTRSGDGLVEIPCSCTKAKSMTIAELDEAIDPQVLTAPAEPPPAAVAAKRETLLFMMLTGCPGCDAVKVVLPGKRHDMRTILDGDIDMFHKHKVQYVPTVVELVDGKEVGKHVGTKALDFVNALPALPATPAAQAGPTRPAAPAAVTPGRYYWPSTGQWAATPQPGYTYSVGADGRQYYAPAAAPVVPQYYQQIYTKPNGRQGRVRCGPGGCYVQ